MKKLVGILVVLSMVTVLLVACGGSSTGSSTATSTTGSGGGNTVHLTATLFSPASITISKGSSITLVNDTATVHIISNGTWENNSPKPGAEPNAPVVNNVAISSVGQTQVIGPFNTAGTFKYYCTVHPNMSLTITVQ